MSENQNQLPIEGGKKTTKELTLDEKRAYYKQKYNCNVFSVKVEDNYAIFKEPNRQTFSEALQYMTPIPGTGQKMDLIQAGIIIMRNGMLESTDNFLTIDNVVTAAAMQAVNSLDFKEAELKKN